MYYPYFITYIVVGFAVTLAVFFWALKNGQFRDQQRARFLPLEDEPELINSDPYGAGWLIKVELEGEADFDDLMNADAYKAYCEGR